MHGGSHVWFCGWNSNVRAFKWIYCTFLKSSNDGVRILFPRHPQEKCASQPTLTNIANIAYDCNGVPLFLSWPKNDDGGKSIVLCRPFISYNFCLFFLAWVNMSSGILTTKDMIQYQDWTSCHRKCSWSTWSMRGEPLLNCGTIITTRGNLLLHKGTSMVASLFFLQTAYKPIIC